MRWLMALLGFGMSVVGMIALFTLVVPLPASAQGDPVNSPATGTPTLIGYGKVGYTIHVGVTGIEDADGLENATFQYQWIRDDGTGNRDISGATNSTYTLAPEDEGNLVNVRVSFTDDLGNPEQVTSIVVEKVGPANNPATGTVTVSGTPRVGETLTADISGIHDADGIEMARTQNENGAAGSAVIWFFDFDWDKWGTLTLLGRSSTIRVKPNFVGKTVTAYWGVLDDLGNPEIFVSAPTAIAAATVPDPPQNLEVSAGSEGDLELSWEAPTWDDDSFSNLGVVGDGGSPITGYKVQWKEAAHSWDSAADVSEATVTGTTHTITGLIGVAYTIRVFATNAIGDGQSSDEATGTPRDNTAPELSAAAVDGSTLTLTYNETLDGSSEPATSAFSVTVNGNARRVTGVSVDGRTVSLDLASPVASGDTVAVSYTDPSDSAASRIQDPSNNAAPSFRVQTATTNTGSTPTPTTTQPETTDPETTDSTLGVPAVAGQGAIANALGEIEVTWTPGANAIGHLLMLFTSDFLGEPVVASKGATDTTHTFMNVPEGDYVVVVVAYNDAVDIQLSITTVSVPNS